MMSTFIRFFQDLNKHDVGLAGGKGASLGEMTQAGIRVPPGFVVLSAAFEQFLKDTDLNVEIDSILHGVDHGVMHTIENASERIGELILGAHMPENIMTEIRTAFGKLGTRYVAVRSSATSEDSAEAAWAGQLDSYLNTKEDALLENVQKCWASLFTPRAIFYRFEKGLHEKLISVAVVVQKMVESEVSGIAFSVHPVTQDYNQLIIEAGFGLGEAIVSGSITPDSYVVEKKQWDILDINIATQERGLFRNDKGGNEWRDLPQEKGEQPTLKNDEVIELAKLVATIEKHYGFPVDIEWARENGKFYIVQSRPITTLKNSSSDAQKHKYDFSWGERHSVISTESWLRGYVSLRHVIGNENKNVLMYVKNGQVNTYNASGDLPTAIDSGRTVLDHGFLKKHLKQTASIREEFQQLFNTVKKVNIENISNSELLAFFETYQELFDKTWAYFKVSQPEYLELAKGNLEKSIQEKANDKNVDQVFITLTTPTEIDLIKQEELATLKRSLDDVADKELWQHAEEYPWLFFNTYDRDVIHTYLEKKFRDLQEIPEDERKHHIQKIHDEFEEHTKNHDALLKDLGSDSDIAYLSSVFGTLAVDRLKMKAWWGGAEYLFLPLFEEIARRAAVTVTDLLMSYTVDDIGTFLREEKQLPSTLGESRKRLYAVTLEEGEMKFYEEAEAQRRFDELIGSHETAQDSAREIRGMVANLGKAKGRARIIVVEDLKRLLEDMDRFAEGDIMVTTMTQPTMVSLARKAAAIVTNEGGITSHASILAREYGIPCIVGTRTATMVIQDGDEVEVDADKGIVKILQQAK